MKIETKFDFGEKVWIMYNNHTSEGIIKNIEIKISPYTDSYQRHDIYAIRHPNGDVSLNVRPESIFRSKEELLKTL